VPDHKNSQFNYTKWTEILHGNDPEEGSSWNAAYMNSMKWRWLPISDPFVDAFMSRDVDSLMIQREVDSVKVWLESDKVGHFMRDNLDSLKQVD